MVAFRLKIDVIKGSKQDANSECKKERATHFNLWKYFWLKQTKLLKVMSEVFGMKAFPLRNI